MRTSSALDRKQDLTLSERNSPLLKKSFQYSCLSHVGNSCTDKALIQRLKQPPGLLHLAAGCDSSHHQTSQQDAQQQEANTYLNRPILRRCENISPPVTNSSTMYKLELSWKHIKKKCHWPRHSYLKWVKYVTLNSECLSEVYKINEHIYMYV